MNRIGKRISAENPKSHAKRTVAVESLHTDMTRGGNRDYSLMMLVVVGFVLLIACSNVANLQIACVSRRNKEIALRVAMGAQKWRISRQIIV